ncbi:MAG: hypothetical protein WA810_05490 [Maribacter sp.]
MESLVQLFWNTCSRVLLMACKALGEKMQFCWIMMILYRYTIKKAVLCSLLPTNSAFPCHTYMLAKGY